VEICLDGPSFYGLISYTVGVTAILSLFGIRVGRRFFRNRSVRSSSQETTESPLETTESPPTPQHVLESRLAAIDLAPQRRGQPPTTICQEDEQFENIMMRVLREGRSTNPFY
jgi:hypothetical protein